MNKKEVKVNKDTCVACGTCVKHCPTKAITVKGGVFADINKEKCVACGKCKLCCPSSAISVDGHNKGKKVHWFESMWILSILYLTLGFFNIIFANIGLLCFTIPLIIATANKNKSYCNKFCGRGQLFLLLGDKHHFSSNRDLPNILTTKWFRYLFLAFFMVMFSLMIFTTYSVFIEAKELSKIVTLFWTFKFNWDFAYIEYGISPWIYQFAFGFYSIMFTSTLIGFIMMVLFKPKSWCVICPMGTSTQLICKARNGKEMI